MFELLQGAGLYDRKEQAMRELLQNAVDATLIRIWREHGEYCLPQPTPFIKRDSAPRSDEVCKKILDNYSIDVNIKKVDEEDQYNYWRITISDQGTGISINDLKFMMQLGSSKKNFKRREVIEKMPIWMKPSGIFGIGLHSVFLLSDEVIIETRSIDTGETLVIRLTNPTSAIEHGFIYFQIITEPKTVEFNSPYEQNREYKPWDFASFGCRLSFVYKSDRRLFSKKYNSKFAGRAFEKHDGLIDKESDFNVLVIEEEIDKFFNIPLLKAKVTKNENEKNSYCLPSNNINPESYYFSHNQKLEIKIAEISICGRGDKHGEKQDKSEEIDINTWGFSCAASDYTKLKPSYYNSLGSVVFFYRGQSINEKSFRLNFLSVSVNLLDEEADKILAIDRNKFRDGASKDELFNRVSDAIQEFFNSGEGRSYYLKLKHDVDKSLIAAEYELQGWTCPEYFKVKWNEILISVFAKNKCQDKKLKDIENFDTVILFAIDEYFQEFQCTGEELIPIGEVLQDYLNNDSVALINIEYVSDSPFMVDSTRNKNAVCTLINKTLKDKGFSCTYFNNYLLLEKNNNDKSAICENLLFLYCSNIGTKDNWLKRESIPILSEEYKELELADYDNFTIEKNKYPIKRAFELDQITPRMLFPLARINDMPSGDDLDILDILARSKMNIKITVGDLDILAKQVYLNRADTEVTEQQIKEKYQKFIAFLDKLMRYDGEWVKLRGDEFKLAD